MVNSNILKIHASILIVGLLFAGLYFIPSANAANSEAGTSAGSGKRIVKWVDSQGVTHYGDKLPVQETGRNNTEMSNQGIVLKHNVKTDTKTEELDQEKLAQQRRDNILLASYTKAEEIDLARDRSLQTDLATLQALTVQKENVASRLARNQKAAEGFTKRNKPLPPYLSEELKLAGSESSRVEKQIAGRKLSMEDTSKHYAAEKTRFMELKETSAPNASATTSTNTTKTN